MPKDPAFLFYPGDWQLGTMTLSRHLKGCYMDLLIAQFNSGSLSLEEIRTVLGTDFSVAWNTLQKKFAQDATGKFFNERLEVEKERRRKFSEKQSLNGKKGGRKPKPNPSLNPNTILESSNKEDETENKAETEIRGVQGGLIKSLPPSQDMVEKMFVDMGLTAEEGVEFYLRVEGDKGFTNLNNWVSYTMAAIQRKIKEKKSFRNGIGANKKHPLGNLSREYLASVIQRSGAGGSDLQGS